MMYACRFVLEYIVATRMKYQIFFRNNKNCDFYTCYWSNNLANETCKIYRLRQFVHRDRYARNLKIKEGLKK